MKPATRWILVGAVTLGLVALWRMLSSRPLEVDVGMVALRPLVVTVDDDGATRVRQRHVVSAPAAGRFEPIHHEVGDVVRQGQIIGRLYPAPLGTREAAEATARLDAAIAAEAAAGAQLEARSLAAEDARRTLERLEALAGRTHVPPEELDRSRTAFETADRAREAARFQVRQAASGTQAARAALAGAGAESGGAPLDVRAPVTGSVLRLVEECSRVVQAGTPVLELGDLRQLEIVVDVLSEDAVRIRPGATVWIATGGEDTLRARVRAVEPAGFTKVSPLGVEEQRVNVVADFERPPRGLGDRYRVEARIVVWDTAGTLTAPAAALFRERDSWAVFQLSRGSARLVRVDIGHRGAELVEVRAGLSAGDTVIVQPGDRVRDGQRVSTGR